MRILKFIGNYYYVCAGALWICIKAMVEGLWNAIIKEFAAGVVIPFLIAAFSVVGMVGPIVLLYLLIRFIVRM